MPCLTLKEEVAGPGVEFLQTLIGEVNMQFLLEIQDDRRFDTVQETISWILSLVPLSSQDKMETATTTIKQEIIHPDENENEHEILVPDNVESAMSSNDVSVLLDEDECFGGHTVEFQNSSEEFSKQQESMEKSEVSHKYLHYEESKQPGAGPTVSNSLSFPSFQECQDSHKSISASSAAIDKEVLSFVMQSEINHHTVEESSRQSMKQPTGHMTNDIGNRGMCTEPKEYVCSICNTKMYNKKEFENHSRLFHSGHRPFGCQICQKVFGMKSNLQAHLRRHTGEKRFNCNVCYKQFMMKHHLQSHMRTHTGARPFSCKVCHRQFAQQSHVKRHLKTHEREMGQFQNQSVQMQHNNAIL